MDSLREKQCEFNYSDDFQEPSDLNWVMEKSIHILLYNFFINESKEYRNIFNHTKEKNISSYYPKIFRRKMGYGFIFTIWIRN